MLRVGRYIGENDAFLKLFFDHYLKTNGKSSISECNFSARDVSIPNEFINDICTAWSHYAFENPINWLMTSKINSVIKVGRKFLFYKYMYENGIVYIQDLYDEQNNRFMHPYNCLIFYIKYYFFR